MGFSPSQDMTLGNIAPNYFWWLISANVPVMSCSSALPSWVGGLADSIVLKIEADGKVVICCQMCHTGNNVTKIPVWPAKNWRCAKSCTSQRVVLTSGPNRGIVDPKVKLWWKSRCGSNHACAQNSRCTQTGRCSAVTFHWPSPETWLCMRFWSWIAMVGISRIKSIAFTAVKMAVLCTDVLYSGAETITAAEISCYSLGVAGGWCSQILTDVLTTVAKFLRDTLN